MWRSVSIAFAVVIIFFTVVVVFIVVFEVVVFLDFDLDLNLNAAPIFPDHLNNFCDPEEPLSSPMTSTTLLTTMLLTIMFSFQYLQAYLSSERLRQSLSIVNHCHCSGGNKHIAPQLGVLGNLGFSSGGGVRVGHRG